MSSDKTTAREEFGFPDPTPESRWRVGCYGSDIGVIDRCWCGSEIILGFGQCPECTGKQDAFIESNKR